MFPQSLTYPKKFLSWIHFQIYHTRYGIVGRFEGSWRKAALWWEKVALPCQCFPVHSSDLGLSDTAETGVHRTLCFLNGMLVLTMEVGKSHTWNTLHQSINIVLGIGWGDTVFWSEFWSYWETFPFCFRQRVFPPILDALSRGRLRATHLLSGFTSSMKVEVTTPFSHGVLNCFEKLKARKRTAVS